MDETAQGAWKESIHRQREELAKMLHEPLALLADKCRTAYGSREQSNRVLTEGHSSIPYCRALYIMDLNGVQSSDNIVASGIMPGHFHRNRADRPYMQESMPTWGFLLSDAYIGLGTHLPSLTALQVITGESGDLGYLGADFDLRCLPVTSALYQEPGHWRQVKGDPSIRSTLFQQTRVDSPLDLNMPQALSILEEMFTDRGVFHAQIHFSSSQAIIWVIDDPFCYRIFDHETLMDTDICLVYPPRAYPSNAVIPSAEIKNILDNMRILRSIDTNIYLRSSSINIFNGMVSLTFSCDGSHYMRYDEFLSKGTHFWVGLAV